MGAFVQRCNFRQQSFLFRFGDCCMFYRLCWQENLKVRFNSHPKRGAVAAVNVCLRLRLNQAQQRNASWTADVEKCGKCDKTTEKRNGLGLYYFIWKQFCSFFFFLIPKWYCLYTLLCFSQPFCILSNYALFMVKKTKKNPTITISCYGEAQAYEKN